MPNIAITNFCNLQCKYCFADDMIQEEPEYMSFEQFQKALAFCSSLGSTRIGIIGGEPTLHPQFGLFLDEVIDFCQHTDSKGLIFTNGINLEPYLDKVGEYIDVLVNCNSPLFQSKEQYEQTLHTLDLCSDLIQKDIVRCGCNIYLDCSDYSYFWKDIVDKYHPPVVRMSLVSPGKCYSSWNTQEKKEDYYSLLKPYVIDFIKEADKRGVKICYDCNQIPICLLTPEEKQLVMKTADELPKLRCDGGMDINIHLEAFMCFSTYDNKVSINQFTNAEDLSYYLLMEHIRLLRDNNKGGMCKYCEKAKLHVCQGGCLSFAKGVK